MYIRWKVLRSKEDNVRKVEMKDFEEKLADMYLDKINDATNEINCDEGGQSSGKLCSLEAGTHQLPWFILVIT